MAEKNSADHDKFMKLHLFKEEYIAKLEGIGIKSPEQLAAALEDEGKIKEIHEHLKGVGPKTIEHWKEDLGARAKPDEKAPAHKPAQKVRKIKEAPKKEEKEEPEKKTGKKAEGEKKEKEEEVKIEEEGYEVKLKPKLSKETLDALKKRAEIGSRRPEFLRQEWHTRKRLQGVKWRKPVGDHSKMRQHYGYRRNVVSIGFGSPKGARHLHPSGFKEVRVWNVKDLERINPEQEAARVAHQVGMKKRLDIEAKAEELGIRVLNRSG